MDYPNTGKRRTLIGCMVFGQLLASAAGFAPSPIHRRAATTMLWELKMPSEEEILLGGEADLKAAIEKEVAEAEEAIQKAKGTIDTKPLKKAKDPDDLDTKESSVPFFATASGGSASAEYKDMIVSTDDNGLIRTDGDKMDKKAESEEWHSKSLSELLGGPISKSEESKKKRNKALQERDVIASLYNLRKTLQTEDYQAIFDKRNRFIGEE